MNLAHYGLFLAAHNHILLLTHLFTTSYYGTPELPPSVPHGNDRAKQHRTTSCSAAGHVDITRGATSATAHRRFDEVTTTRNNAVTTNLRNNTNQQHNLNKMA
jgi:hypothetical protein